MTNWAVAFIDTRWTSAGWSPTLRSRRHNLQIVFSNDASNIHHLLPAFDDQAGSKVERFDDITTSLEVFIRSFKTLTHLSCEVSQAFYLLNCQRLRLKIRRQSFPLLL